MKTLIKIDSRKICPGDIFIAYKGEKFDGHLYIQQAIQAGASKIIYEDAAYDGKIKIANEWVPSARARWPFLESDLRGNPEKKLIFLGVTGTNGKTSSVQMIRSLLKISGVDCLAIGTLGAQIGDEQFETGLTTPDPDKLFELLEIAVNRNIKVVVMEVSSHAIHFQKFGPIRFSVTGFTSFSQDHLDIHKTMDEYFSTKLRLLSELSQKDSVCFIHESVTGEIPTRGSLSPAYSRPGTGDDSARYHYYASKVLQRTFEGMRIKIDQRQGLIPFFGDFLADNFCCALLMTEKYLKKTISADDWKKLLPVPGRLEAVKKKSGREPLVIVDYAHTPDGLEKAILACKKFTTGKVHTVFGCGGDRDKTKRPQMGAIAEKLSDVCYVTSDNPRTEDPQKIISEITGAMKRKNFSHPDRRLTIKEALSHAGSEDTILIAGKGHETYQIIGDQKFDFDDREVARQLLKELVK